MFFIWIIIGYLSGSIPTGYLLGRLKGIDLTKIGSGSTGATNVLRSLGKGPALMTVSVDVLKGFLPIYFVIKYTNNSWLATVVAIVCIIGHSKSMFLKFKGGKSSATALGIMLAMSWKVALISFSLWLIIVGVSKYSSLGSIIAIPLVPIWLYVFKNPLAYILFTVFVAVYVVLIRHRDNIKRLLEGKEPKIGQSR